jgi:hypothetical protein
MNIENNGRGVKLFTLSNFLVSKGSVIISYKLSFYKSNVLIICSLIFLLLKPYLSYKSDGSPDSGNISFNPILCNLTPKPSSAIISATAEPKPPIIV